MGAKLWIGLMLAVILGVAVAGWATHAVRWTTSRARRSS
jgi:hypothetical protein